MTKQAHDKYAISVVVPTYNRAQQLAYTLASLATQTLDRSDFEVVVVDDGSCDDTFQVVKGFERQINVKYVYQTDRGYCVSSARNLGICVAGGTFCMFIDSGIIVKSDCLSQHLDRHAQQTSEAAVIGYTYGWGAPEGALNLALDPHDADGSIARLMALGTVFDIRENIFRKYNYQIENLSAPWTLFYGGHLSIPRKSLFEVGLFDENYDGKWGAEDQDLGYRLHRASKKIVLCRNAMVLHLPHPSDSKAKSKQGYENCRYFHQKFQTVESKLFFDSYASDVSRQITHREVLDFHELLTGALQRQ